MINKYTVCITAFFMGLAFPALGIDYSPDAVEKRGDLFYVKATGEPLTGTLVRVVDGGKIQSVFMQGVLNGESRGVFENGKTSHVMTFKNNQKDGPFKQFDENGKLLMQAGFKDNKLNGEFTAYYPNGNPSVKEVYRDDMLNGPKTTYYETGKLKSLVNFVNNRHEGAAKTFYEDGTLQSEFWFKDNQREGIGKIYYPNSKVQFEMNYVHDKLNGENNNYKDNGTLVQKRMYKNGLVESGVIYQDGKAENLTAEQIDELNSKTMIHTAKNSFEKDGVRLDLKTEKPISGVYFVLNDNGFAVEEYQYWQGKPHGIMQRFNERGNVIERAFYQNGEKKAYQQLDQNGNITKTCQENENHKEVCQ